LSIDRLIPTNAVGGITGRNPSSFSRAERSKCVGGISAQVRSVSSYKAMPPLLLRAQLSQSFLLLYHYTLAAGSTGLSMRRRSL
jgi:hypothetical protein